MPGCRKSKSGSCAWPDSSRGLSGSPRGRLSGPRRSLTNDHPGIVRRLAADRRPWRTADSSHGALSPGWIQPAVGPASFQQAVHGDERYVRVGLTATSRSRSGQKTRISGSRPDQVAPGPGAKLRPLPTERSHRGLVRRFAKPLSGVTCSEGSNPSLSAKSRRSVACARSSVDRALGCGPKGRGFESRRARQHLLQEPLVIDWHWRRRLARVRHPRRLAARLKARARHSVAPGPTETAYVLMSLGKWLPRAAKAIILRRIG